MKKIGITDICSFFGDPKQHPLSFSDAMSPEEMNTVKAAVAAHGVRIVEVCGGGDYSVLNGVDKQIEISKRHLDIAAKLDAKIFRVFGGWINEKQATDKTYDQISACLAEVGAYAGKYGIIVAMENHGGVTRTGEQVARIMNKVPSGNVGVNYDPANFQFHGEDAYTALMKIKDRVVFTHLKNCKMLDGKMHYCRLAEGNVDYASIYTELKRFYAGYWSLEYEEASDVEAGTMDDAAYVKSLLNS